MSEIELNEFIRSIEMSPMRKYGIKIFISKVCHAYKLNFDREITNVEMLIQYIYEHLLESHKHDGMFVLTVKLMLEHLDVVEELLEEVLFDNVVIV